MRALGNREFEKYQAEAKEKWGKTDTYREYTARTKDYSGQKWDDLAAGMDQVMAQFACCMQQGESSHSPQAQALVKTLQDFITGNYYPCTTEILAGLGQMYIADERFRGNIDKHAQGTAAFISEAIAVYCQK